MRVKKLRDILLVVVNTLIIGLVAYSVLAAYFGTADGNMVGSGFVIFRYYTLLSNVFAGLLCVPMFVAAVRKLSGHPIPQWVSLLSWIGTADLAVTFFVVVCFLSFLYSFKAMFVNENLYLHGVTPVLCMLSFIFLDENSLKFKNFWMPLVPLASYGVVYFIMVVVLGNENGGWPDFYGFNMGGRWYISLILMAIAGVAISVVLWLARKLINKCGKKAAQEERVG